MAPFVLLFWSFGLSRQKIDVHVIIVWTSKGILTNFEGRALPNNLNPETMARFFKEQDIDEFRDCFYLNTTSSGQIMSVQELKIIMRSLGMSPTLTELDTYLRDKGGKLSFADFLDVMHTHSTKEKIPQELIAAFEATDPKRTGLTPSRDLKHILNEWGEKLEPKEIDSLFREANLVGRHQVNYHDLIRVVSAPVPDY